MIEKKESWSQLWKSIHENAELIEHEQEGFKRGQERGKTMNVPLGTILNTLKKQYDDLGKAITIYYVQTPNVENVFALKRALADLRNAAGCSFRKLQEVHGK